MGSHRYEITVRWTGNQGDGTSGYREYHRSHLLSVPGRPDIEASADPAFRGDPASWSPEQLFVASLSQCHMLWFLHLAAVSGVVVTNYKDVVTAHMKATPDGGGQFTEATLHPVVTVADPAMVDAVDALHRQAHERCFIARSVNFPVECEATTRART